VLTPHATNSKQEGAKRRKVLSTGVADGMSAPVPTPRDLLCDGGADNNSAFVARLFSPEFAAATPTVNTPSQVVSIGVGNLESDDDDDSDDENTTIVLDDEYTSMDGQCSSNNSRIRSTVSSRSSSSSSSSSKSTSSSKNNTSNQNSTDTQSSNDSTTTPLSLTSDSILSPANPFPEFDSMDKALREFDLRAMTATRMRKDTSTQPTIAPSTPNIATSVS
jgi:hypothetical protein